MKLEDTIAMMTSDNYKDRFRAEYWQTKIRLEKLEKMIELYLVGKTPINVNASVTLLQEQAGRMRRYLDVLVERAGHEMIFLGEANESKPDEPDDEPHVCGRCVYFAEGSCDEESNLPYHCAMGKFGVEAEDDNCCGAFRSLEKAVEDVCEACRITYSHERESDRDNQTGEAMESLNSIRRKTAREYGEDPDA